jgi:hypothetical protein
MPGSTSETQGRFCDGLGSNIMLSVGPIITLHGRITAREYVDSLGNHVHSAFRCYFLPNNDAVFQDDNVLIHTAELFSHGLKNMKVNFIFPGRTVTRFEHD